MILHPVVRQDACIELAHHSLPDIIHTVLIVPLVKFRHAAIFCWTTGSELRW